MQPSHSPNQCCKRTSPMRAFIIFTALLLTVCQVRPQTKHLLVETEDENGDKCPEGCGWAVDRCFCGGLKIDKNKSL